MKFKSVIHILLIVAIVISLTPVCSVVAVAKTDSLDEVTLLGGVAKESLTAIDAAAKQTETDLAAIQARLKTQLTELSLSTSKAIELLNQLKETREDRRDERFQRAQALVELKARIKIESAAINQQITEAKEKAEAAREAALTALVVACVSAAIQTGAAAASFAGTAALTTLLQKQLFNVNFQVLEIRKDVGLTVRIRAGQTTSCLSTKQQCSGLSFSNTK